MTKIDIFSGFLGAGKTTLIKKLISEAYTGEKLVLIENEFGDIGVDGGFLKDAGIEITEMSAGCICCTLVGDFERSLRKVLDEMQPERILIEPSGVGKLSDVIKAVQQVCDENVVLNSFTTVVDAKKCKMHAKNFGEFFINQIEYASSVILSHTQGMSQEKLDQVMALVREHNTVATVVTTDWDKLTGAQIKDTMEHKNTLRAELEKLAREKADEDAKRHEEEHHHHHGDAPKAEQIVYSENSHVMVVKEIDCPHCCAKLAKAVAKIEGISNVHINHETERMVFDCENFDATVAAIKKTIEDVLPEAVLCEEIPMANVHKMVIKDIDCPHCCAKLTKAVAKIEGIANVAIDHEAERITFECDDFAATVAAINKTIEDVLPEAKLCEEILPCTEKVCCCGHHHHDEECECDHEHHEHEGHTHTHTYTKVEATITDIDCPHCAGKLKGAIEALHGMRDVAIDHEACVICFTCPEGCVDDAMAMIKDTIADVLPEAKLGAVLKTEDFEEECHGHHHHDDEECECGCEHHHHDDDEECECGCEHNHHHDDEECECGCEHNHHHDDEECECGHEHHHHHHDHDEHEHHHEHSHEGHHHADDIFQSWGVETATKYSEADIAKALDALDDNEKYGMILRAKGFVAREDDGDFIHFDYIPGEVNVRRGPADVIGRLCVIGAGINEDAIKALFTK